jgi:putative glutamine amidotransferase
MRILHNAGKQARSLHHNGLHEYGRLEACTTIYGVIMAIPIILVTTGIVSQEGKTPLCQCGNTYLKALVDSGAYPVILPPIPNNGTIKRLLDSVDGLLVTGGGDIDPVLYGESRHPKCGIPSSDRDETEISAVKIAIEMGIPVFGICRGHQVLNVALGGNLIQDIPSQVSNSITHSNVNERRPQHSVEIVDSTMLRDIERDNSIMVNSIHHQAVKKLGDGLRVSAKSEDGVIEAIESTDGRPVLSVQWHPEENTNEYPQFKKLFEWFVSQATKL